MYLLASSLLFCPPTIHPGMRRQ
uniref:Uncharacterized protein n=1 Tax=Triticum urartu TaxID=4572 RepID=A0A8R7QD89_TRIUA